MDFIINQNKKNISIKRMEQYLKLNKILQWGRRAPCKFVELVFGLEFL